MPNWGISFLLKFLNGRSFGSTSKFFTLNRVMLHISAKNPVVCTSSTKKCGIFRYIWLRHDIVHLNEKNKLKIVSTFNSNKTILLAPLRIMRQTPEAYLGPCQTFMMYLFCKNSKNAKNSIMFDRALNTSVITLEYFSLLKWFCTSFYCLVGDYSLKDAFEFNLFLFFW